MTDPATMPPPPPKADGPGLFEDLIETITAPAKVFARRAKTGSAAAFFTVAIALGAIIYSGKSTMEPIIDAQMAKGRAAALKANPNLTPEQLDTGMAFQKKLAPVFTALGPPIVLLILALFIWIVGKILGGQVTYGSSLMIASFSYVPRVIGAVIVDVQGLLTSDLSKLTNASQISLSPARFMDPAAANPMVLAVLGRFDIITIWVTVLIGVGYFAAGKMSKGKAIGGTVILWLVATLGAVWGASRGG